jgi:hypothetical protein
MAKPLCHLIISKTLKVIVSHGADFLGTWLSPVVFANQYAKTRRINTEKPEMSRHFQFESYLSLTGLMLMKDMYISHQKPAL